MKFDQFRNFAIPNGPVDTFLSEKLDTSDYMLPLSLLEHRILDLIYDYITGGIVKRPVNITRAQIIKVWYSLCTYLGLRIYCPLIEECMFMIYLNDCIYYYKEVHSDLRTRYIYSYEMKHSCKITDDYFDLIPVLDIRSKSVAHGHSCALLGSTEFINPVHASKINRSFMEHYLGSNIPWYTKDKGGVIIAGGFLVSSLFGLTQKSLPDNSDIDIFIVNSSNPDHCDDYKRSWDYVLQLYNSMRMLYTNSSDRLYVFMYKKVINIIVKRSAVERSDSITIIKVQIIIRLYSSPAQVVHGFDISPSKILFDGTRLMATPSAVHSYETGVMLYDQTKMSLSGPYRYIKYMLRYNFRCAILGFTSGDLELLENYGPYSQYNVVSLMKRYFECRLIDSCHTPPPLPSDYLDDHEENLSINTSFANCGYVFYTLLKNNTLSNRNFSGSFHPVKCDIYANIKLKRL